MSILIISKTTAFEEMGVSVQDQLAYQNDENLRRIRQAHEEHLACLAAIESELAAAKLDYERISREAEPTSGGTYQIVIAVGGDGTLLAASHKLNGDELLIGVNSSSLSIGYHCFADRHQIPALVLRIREGRLPRVEIQRLHARVTRARAKSVETSMPVLNDVLYAHRHPGGTSRYCITYGGRSERHKSSGMWISTAGGSTAGILAAGGSKMKVTDRRFQFRVRELYRIGDEDLQIENGFFDEGNPLIIENSCREALLAIDGQHGVISLNYGDRIDFMRARPINLCLDPNFR